jgi:hypothetical protein
MKKFSILVFSLLFLAACQEQDLTNENPAPPEENVKIAFRAFYGGSGIKSDSVYTNALGLRFQIDSAKAFFTDLQFVDINTGDSIEKNQKNFYYFEQDELDVPLARMEAGGYYGRFLGVFGLDSASYFEAMQENQDFPEETLRNNAAEGLDFLNIWGRLYDPNDPTDSIGSIPLTYQFGTYMLTDTAYSGVRAFSVDNRQAVTLIIIADLKPMFDRFNMFTTQEFFSDPTDRQDFEVAQSLLDSMSIAIF